MKTSPHKPSKFHDVKSIALMVDTSERTVRRWIASGELPSHKFGGVVRISDEDLQTFIKEKRQ